MQWWRIDDVATSCGVTFSLLKIQHNVQLASMCTRTSSGQWATITHCPPKSYGAFSGATINAKAAVITRTCRCVGWEKPVAVDPAHSRDRACMLPAMAISQTNRIVDERDFNAPIDEKSIRDHLRRINDRWENVVSKMKQEREVGASGGEYGDQDGADTLHAELVVHTTAADERRAGELLELAEAAVLRTLGGIPSTRINTSVVTSQPATEATLVLHTRGVEIAAAAFGIGRLDMKAIEDFVVTKASIEYQTLMHRFMNTDTLDGSETPRLTVRLYSSGRTLVIQRPLANIPNQHTNTV
jgi:hypothetical protein